MARKDAPTGREIAEKARGHKLDKSKEGVGEKGGKKSVLTPAVLDHVKTQDDLEQGAFIGVLKSELDGESLAPGTYNMFIAKVGSDWQVYAESNGDVAGVASVTERPATPAGMKPEFKSGSFCWWVWLIFTGFEWCF